MIDAPQQLHKSSGFTEDTRELRGVVATVEESEAVGERRWWVDGLEEGGEKEVAASPPLFLAACRCAAHKQEI